MPLLEKKKGEVYNEFFATHRLSCCLKTGANVEKVSIELSPFSVLVAGHALSQQEKCSIESGYADALDHTLRGISEQFKILKIE